MLSSSTSLRRLRFIGLAHQRPLDPKGSAEAKNKFFRLRPNVHFSREQDIGLYIDVLMDGRKVGEYKPEALKKIDLVFAPSATAIAVQTRPISLQMALFAGIECCFAALPSGGRIEIKALSENGEKRVIVNCQGTDLKDISFSETLVESHKWKFFLDLVEDIEGRHELDALHRRLSVFLPEVMEAENGNVDASNDKTE